ncbi:MAG: hypothetical protein KME07_19760 [Pegethrix bostrychoides GSE-TBD4-15B]|jgi:hypothetical protein|uniref:Uncharacterized protein n=1 Tax=Pegethrix bostrychoides GSE-TBD4-15B TaxID=2839662 RepID=A0A951U688_9CYAN|nr:hypothetical protein [Pegethrix bostrychoides GSE-TBD4-15B]
MSNKDVSSKDVAVDSYDSHIVPAETAARKEREGDAFKQTPHQDEDEDLDTSAGYTVDKEGLVNNYAIEPEMYIDEPGDLREKEEQLARERGQELAEVRQDDETGKLTEDGDQRGKGPGII